MTKLERLLALSLIVLTMVSFCACKKTNTGAPLKGVDRLEQATSSKGTSKDDASSEKSEENSNEDSSSKAVGSSSKVNSSTNSKKPVSQTEQSTPSKKEEAKKPTPQQLIHGSWKGEVPMNEYFEEQGMTADKTLYLTFNMTFFPGGSYREFVYTDSYKKLMWDLMDAEIANSGMSKAEFEAQYEKDAGITLSEYIDAVVQSTINDFVTDYHYKFEGEKLYYKEEIEPETEYKEMGYRFSSDGNMVEFTQEGQKVLFYRQP